MVLGRSAAAPYDSRLLVTLVKAEKEAHDSFKTYTNSCENATNALNGWAAADTGDSPDVLTVSNRVCELFDDAADAQKTYLISLMNYRSSLKDVAAREAEIRVILRDRDIFVSRLVKLNSKRTPNSESALESHNAKLEEARAELAACESTLKSEERALVGVKRRIFREALRMRMRAMAQLADVWRTTADRSIQILDSLEGGIDGSSMTDLRLVQPQHFPQQPAAPVPAPQSLAPTTPSTRFRDSRTIDGSVIFQSPEGSVIAPSHSASQMARKAAGYPDDYSEYGYEDDQSRTHDGTMLGATAPIQEEDEAGGSSVEGGDDGLNSQKYQVHINTPLTPAQIAEQKARERAASMQQPVQRAPSARENGVGNQAQSNRLVNGDRPSQGTRVQGSAFGSQQSTATPQPSPSAATAQTNGILGAMASSSGVTAGQAPANDASRKRISTSAPQLTPQSTTRRETAEERSKRFSSLDTGAVAAAYSGLQGPSPILPSATQYTLDAHNKRVAPEATLFLPSSDTRTKSYRVTQDESDEEIDEVGQLRSHAGSRSAKGGSRRGRSEDNESIGSYGGSTSRKLQSGRSARASAIYQQSDAGESTVAGRDKRQPRVRYETEHKGGLFSGLTGLFRRREATPIKRYDDDDDVTPQTSPRTRKNPGSLLKKGGRKDGDSDSDAPNSRSLVKVYNNPGRAAPMPLDWAALDTRQPASRVIPTSRSWVPPPERQKAMSDIGLPRSSTTGTVKRKSSLKNPSAGVAASVDGASVKKKKRSSTISGPSGYDAAALVGNVTNSLVRGNMGGVNTQNPAQKVTRSTPSLMSVVAPKAGDTVGMHLPDAKNPGLSLLQPISRNLGTLPAPTPASAEPLKKKKSVKKSPTNGNIAAGSTGLTQATLRTSVTAPTIANLATKTSDTALAAPKPPASILSVGSDSSARRKSVRLASDTKFSEATYTNSGGPAQLNALAAPVGILKDGTNSAGEWNVRSGEQDAYSSDEGGDEYAKIRAQLNRAERDWQQAGFVDKGKKRA